MFRKLFVLFTIAFLWHSFINNSADAGTQLIGKEIDAEAQRFVEISAVSAKSSIVSVCRNRPNR
jgi:hypothetical protein